MSRNFPPSSPSAAQLTMAQWVNRLKWKPPSENSIDFKLELRFPPQRGKPSEPDFFAKPAFILNEWKGGSGNNAKYDYFDMMEIDDAKWEKCVVFSPLGVGLDD